MEVNKRNKHIGIIILIGFLLIVTGIVSYIVINYNDDKAEVKKRMEVVLNTYDTFKSDVDNFNTIRDSIYSEIMQDMYYETLKNNDSNYKNLFEKYKESLKVVDKDYNKIKGKCINVLHPNASVNNKCEAMIVAYEEVVNNYVSDVKNYNKNIELYNNWIKENGNTLEELKEIELDRDYIDVNGDREYKGKIEKEDEIKSNDDNSSQDESGINDDGQE